MKSFINFLLEGQAEVDSAIQKIDRAENLIRRGAAGRYRLERIVDARTKPQKAESPMERDERKFKNSQRIGKAYAKKFDTKIKPEIK